MDDFAGAGLGFICLVYAIPFIVCGLAAMELNKEKGHNGAAGFMLGFFLFILGFLYVGFRPTNQVELNRRMVQRGERKHCHMCGELIHPLARVCAYCRVNLQKGE